jgi:hypothetical protein
VLRSRSIEDYSYFTLRRSATSTHPATSLFGISCTRQLDASKLINRPVDVTRSTVQKAIVVISDRPQCFGAIKAQLGVVTAAWFAQKDFTDIEILQRFQESLPQLLRNQEGQADQDFGRPNDDFNGMGNADHSGLSLRELIHEFKWQTLVLFKCALLQPKVSRQDVEGVHEIDTTSGSFLRFALRAIMHDAICPYFSDTRPYPPPTRFC